MALAKFDKTDDDDDDDEGFKISNATHLLVRRSDSARICDSLHICSSLNLNLSLRSTTRSRWRRRPPITMTTTSTTTTTATPTTLMHRSGKRAKTCLLRFALNGFHDIGSLISLGGRVGDVIEDVSSQCDQIWRKFATLAKLLNFLAVLRGHLVFGKIWAMLWQKNILLGEFSLL